MCELLEGRAKAMSVKSEINRELIGDRVSRAGTLGESCCG